MTIDLSGDRLDQLRAFLLEYRKPGDHKDLQVIEAKEQVKALDAISYKMEPLRLACVSVKDQYAKVAYAVQAKKAEGTSALTLSRVGAALLELRDAKDRLDVLATEVHHMADIELNGIRHPAWGAPADYISNALAAIDVRTLLHSANHLSEDTGEALDWYHIPHS
jgi:hypothetical protein